MDLVLSGGVNARRLVIILATLFLSACGFDYDEKVAEISGDNTAFSQGVNPFNAQDASDPLPPEEEPEPDPLVPPPADDPAGVPNSPPFISGAPASEVLVGDDYRFQVEAMDPDGDTLIFSISNRPVWASFDAVTGELSGTPGPEHVGMTENIVILASDQTDSSELPAFAINVVQAATGSVTLNWLAPEENTDGSPIIDLAGYRIYFGQDPDRLDEVIAVDNPGVTTYMIENLTPATYYFSMTAINAEGLESEPSGTASTNVS
jgi:hypothetical protein